MEARGKRAAFSKVRWARSVRPRRRQLPQGPSVCDKIGASSDCSRPVNDYVHIEAADLRRPNARFTTERQGYQVLTPFGKLGYSPKTDPQRPLPTDPLTIDSIRRRPTKLSHLIEDVTCEDGLRLLPRPTARSKAVGGEFVRIRSIARSSCRGSRNHPRSSRDGVREMCC